MYVRQRSVCPASFLEQQHNEGVETKLLRKSQKFLLAISSSVTAKISSGDSLMIVRLLSHYK